MSDEHDELTPHQRRFLARVVDAYQAPRRSPERSAAFQREVEARIARARVPRWVPALAGAVATAAIAWLAVGIGLERGASVPREGEERVATAEEAILALSTDEESSDEALPDDYVAIANVFLGSQEGS
jgi:hypothetical protein